MQGHAYYTAQLKQLETHIIFSLLTPFNPLFQFASYNFNDELAISRPVFFNDKALSPRGCSGFQVTGMIEGFFGV